MGPTLNTVTFSEFTDLVRKTFVTNQQLVQSNAKQLYITDPVGKGQGKTKRYDEIDTETFGRRKYEAGAASKTRVGIGYNKTMTKKRIAREIDITQEMRDENRFPEVGSLITNLTHFCPQRIELDLTHMIFTFADATSYVDMDGDTVDTTTGDTLAPASSVHTLKYSSSTWSNIITGAPVFSRGAVEAAEMLANTNILSNFGERRIKTFNTIITTDDPNTVNTVKIYLNSTSDPDQNNSGVINVTKNKYRHVILPYGATTATGAYDSTKRRRWALASVGLGVNGLQAYYGEWEAPHLKEAPASGKNNEDYSRDVWTYGTRAGYGSVIVSARGIIYSLVVS